MSKKAQQTARDPFGPQGGRKGPPDVPKPAPAPSEEDTPVTGNYVPKGVVTKATPPALPAPDPNVPESPTAAVARDLAEIGTLRGEILAARRDLEQATAVIQDQSGQIAALKEALALANASHEVTEADVQRLHAMFAEIGFERSRDGHSFVITLKGSRSNSGGRVNKFGSFGALLQHLRTTG